MRERYWEEGRLNLLEAQKVQKRWYDQKACQRGFNPEQKFLLLLPLSTSKLLAKCQGPFVITREMDPTTYEVFHPDKGKQKQIYHVNLLKPWEERTLSPNTFCTGSSGG